MPPRRRNSGDQPPVPPSHSPVDMTARRMVVGVPWCGRSSFPSAERDVGQARLGRAEAPEAKVAVQGPVDRREPLEAATVDVTVRGPDGTVLVILRRDLGFPSGPLPGDPFAFGPGTPVSAVCASLPAPAALRCLRSR